MEITGNHFDYVHQAWTKDGRYIRCGHPATMDCRCYGKSHEGQPANPNDLPTAEGDEVEGWQGRKYGANNTTNTGEDGYLPALS